MGLVTRCSTSLAPAPGICAKMSIMGTMIWGSSSLGSATTAGNPEKDGGDDDQGGELGVDKKMWLFFPAGPIMHLMRRFQSVRRRPFAAEGFTINRVPSSRPVTISI